MKLPLRLLVVFILVISLSLGVLSSMAMGDGNYYDVLMPDNDMSEECQNAGGAPFSDVATGDLYCRFDIEDPA